ncbi:hypothetical protein A7A52_18530 [Acinetobacter baumannii]|nr:hypothetical protein A7A52_18530 [Acinetobacter baumannii]
MSLARNATASQSPTQTNGYERHQPDQTLVMTILAANPHETILQTATLEEVVEFLLDVARQVLTLGFE